MKKYISDKDKRDWENFLNSNEKLENKDNYLKKIKNLGLKELDLHGYTIRDANIAVKDLILKSYNENIKKIKIITGKGMRSKNLENPFNSKDLSILKYAVPDFIQNDKDLMEKMRSNSLDYVKKINGWSQYGEKWRQLLTSIKKNY